MADKEGGEAERPDVSTRFEPGRSGNPGGRPAADQVVRRLAAGPAWSALRVLVSALDDGAELILIDARGLELGRECDRCGLEREDYDVVLGPPEVGVQAEYLARAKRRWTHEAVFDVDWVSEEVQERADSGVLYTVCGKRHLGTGEWLGWWQHSQLREEFVEHRIALEEIGGAAELAVAEPIGAAEL